MRLARYPRRLPKRASHFPSSGLYSRTFRRNADDRRARRASARSALDVSLFHAKRNCSALPRGRSLSLPPIGADEASRTIARASSSPTLAPLLVSARDCCLVAQYASKESCDIDSFDLKLPLFLLDKSTRFVRSHGSTMVIAGVSRIPASVFIHHLPLAMCFAVSVRFLFVCLCVHSSSVTCSPRFCFF